MAIIDARPHGLAPGRTKDGGMDVIQMPASTLIEILNMAGDDFWFAIDPPGDTFVPGAAGSQVVRSGEYIELTVSGSPKVCLRGPGSHDYQVRRLA